MAISLGTIYGDVQLKLENLNSAGTQAKGIFSSVEDKLKSLTHGLGGHKEAADSSADATKTLGDKHEQAGAQVGKATEAVSSFRDHALRIAEVVGVVAGLKFGFDFLKESIFGSLEKAEEAQNSFAQLTTVIKSTGGAAGVTAERAHEYAQSLSEVTRFDDEAVQGAQSMLLTFTNIGAKGGIFDQATKTALDMSQALGQDLKSSSIQLGKALNDPIKGVTALQRVGVTFDDEQKKLIATYVQHGDMAAAQTVILKELQKEFGGSAEAAGNTFAGKLDILHHRMDDVQKTIGQALKPVLSDLLGRVMPLVSAFGEWLPGAMKAVGTFWNTNIEPLLTKATDLFGNVVKTVQSLGEHFATAFSQDHRTTVADLGAKAKELGGHIKDLGDWAEQNLVPALQHVAEFMGNATSKVIDFSHWLKDHQDVVASVGIGVGVFAGIILISLIPAFVGWAIAAGGAAIAQALLFAPILLIVGGIALLAFGIIQLVKHWGDITKAVGDFLGGAGRAIGDFFSGLGDKVHRFLTAVQATWNGWLADLHALINRAFQTILDIITAPIRAIVGMFKWLFDHNTYFHDLVLAIMAAFNWVRDEAIKLWNGFTDLLGKAWKFIQNVAKTDFELLKKFIIDPIQNAVEWVLGKIAGFRDKLGEAWGFILGKAQELWTNLQTAFQNGVKVVMDFVHDHFIKPIQDTFDLAKKAFEWGKNLIQGFMDGLGSMKDALFNAAKNVLGPLANVLGFHSPAKEGPGSDADTWAPNLMTMYAAGIAQGKAKVADAATDTAAAVKDRLTKGGGQLRLAGLSTLDLGANPARAAALAGGSTAAGANGGQGAGGPTYNITVPVTIQAGANDHATPEQLGERFGKSAAAAMGKELTQRGY